ncbi:MAG: carboxymuconolactone decarboxylase family protein [Gemmatimonadaceae bacterium]
MVHDSTTIGQTDVDVARKAGWSDEALYDAITVCSLFQFYNNWIDATGVSDMPAIGYQMSGQRLATQGYASAPPPAPKSASKKRSAKAAKKAKSSKRRRS